jgi:hypothetical protein
MFGGVVAIILGIALGMYLSSQIEISIFKNVRKNKLLDNLKKWEEEEKKHLQK